MITVAICTWNRAELLQKTLQRLALTHGEIGIEWELLIVNNNCTDNTSVVVAQFNERLPIRMLCEEKQGHSNARNRILGEAKGEYIVWTDDDVLVCEGWLEAYRRAFDQNDRFSFFGGPVEPWLEVDLPKWMRQSWSDVAGVLAIREESSNPCPLDKRSIPVGANMACKTEVGKQFIFNPKLGRMKSELIGGDEVAWFFEMMDAGHLGMWVGDARVKHFIPKERLTKEYLSTWYQKSGVAAARKQASIPVARLFGFPAWAIKAYLISFVSQVLLRPLGSKRWFEAYRDMNRLKGFLAESRKIGLR
jgi:glycosyltransferase involved in cell wall biosynthesis